MLTVITMAAVRPKSSIVCDGNSVDDSGKPEWPRKDLLPPPRLEEMMHSASPTFRGGDKLT